MTVLFLTIAVFNLFAIIFYSIRYSILHKLPLNLFVLFVCVIMCAVSVSSWHWYYMLAYVLIGLLFAPLATEYVLKHINTIHRALTPRLRIKKPSLKRVKAKAGLEPVQMYIFINREFEAPFFMAEDEDVMRYAILTQYDAIQRPIWQDRVKLVGLTKDGLIGKTYKDKKLLRLIDNIFKEHELNEG